MVDLRGFTANPEQFPVRYRCYRYMAFKYELFI